MKGPDVRRLLCVATFLSILGSPIGFPPSVSTPLIASPPGDAAGLVTMIRIQGDLVCREQNPGHPEAPLHPYCVTECNLLAS